MFSFWLHPYKHYKKYIVKKLYTFYFPILFENYKITNLTMYRHYDYYKYYKITDITNYSNNYILVCQSNAERKLQNYKPYKHLYNQHMKKNKKNYNLTNITKNSWSKNCMHGIFQCCLKITKLRTLQCISIMN